MGGLGYAYPATASQASPAGAGTYPQQQAQPAGVAYGQQAPNAAGGSLSTTSGTLSNPTGYPVKPLQAGAGGGYAAQPQVAGGDGYIPQPMSMQLPRGGPQGGQQGFGGPGDPANAGYGQMGAGGYRAGGAPELAGAPAGFTPRT